MINHRYNCFGLVVITASVLWVTGAYGQRSEAGISTALIGAIKRSDTTAAISMLRQGADPNAKVYPVDTRSLWKKLRDQLTAHRPPIKAFQTALLLTLQGQPGSGPTRENVSLVKELLDRGADVNVRNDQGTTAALISCFDTGDDEWQLVQLLLKHGADVGVKSAKGFTALSLARKFKNTSSLRLLEQVGAREYANEASADLHVFPVE